MQSLNQDLHSFFTQIKDRTQFIHSQNYSHICHFLSKNIPERDKALKLNDSLISIQGQYNQINKNISHYSYLSCHSTSLIL